MFKIFNKGDGVIGQNRNVGFIDLYFEHWICASPPSLIPALPD